jgi:hypothetical protein
MKDIGEAYFVMEFKRTTNREEKKSYIIDCAFGPL